MKEIPRPIQAAASLIGAAHQARLDVGTANLVDRLQVEREATELIDLKLGWWLIWSAEHNAWWRPNENGYTKKRDEAGRYSFQHALRIVDGANEHAPADRPNEAMILDSAHTP